MVQVNGALLIGIEITFGRTMLTINSCSGRLVENSVAVDDCFKADKFGSEPRVSGEELL